MGSNWSMEVFRAVILPTMFCMFCGVHSVAFLSVGGSAAYGVPA